ncbi:MAG: VWA domain-containing protein [Acidobacteria bacterium]|nr:VWA domain-containing protein [Acidobacteriota bacterium]
MVKYAKLVLFIIISSFIFIGSAGPADEDKDKEKVKENEPLVHMNVNVELRLIDVIVLDSDGEHVTDLKPEDFEIYEDGDLQKIITFDNLMYKIKRPGELDTENIPESNEAKKPEAEKKKEPLSNVGKLIEAPKEATGRSIIILFDNYNTYQAHLVKAKKAAKEFITNDLLPEDRVAVIRYYGSVKVLQDFTDDKGKLYEAIDELEISIGDAVGAPEIANESMEVYGGTGGRDGYSTVDLLKGGRGGEYYNLNYLDRGLKPNSTTGEGFTGYDYQTGMDWDPKQKYFIVKNFMDVLHAMSLVLKEIPGRKTIIFMSPGFLGVNIKNMPWAFSSMGNMLEKISGYNITMYSVDVSGVATDPTGKRDERWDFLSYVTEKTGGKLFKNKNDLLKQLQRVNYEISRYYLLGYRSSNRYDDGRFLDIKVKCRRPGTTVKTVRGIYAARSWDKKTLDERKSEMLRTLNSGKIYDTLPLKIDSNNTLPSTGGKIVFPFIVRFPVLYDYKKFEFLSYDIDLRVKDKNGEEIDNYFQEIRIDKDDLVGDEIVLNYPMLLPTGENQVEFIVKNNFTDKVGTYFMKANIPEQIKGFAVTEPKIFSSDYSSTLIYPKSSGRIVASEYYPHVYKGLKPQSSRKLYTDSNTVLHFCMINFGLDYAKQNADVDIEYVFSKYGEVIKVPVEVQKFLDGENKDVLTVLLKIPPETLKPGKYNLSIYAKDNASGVMMRKNLPLLFTSRRTKPEPKKEKAVETANTNN